MIIIPIYEKIIILGSTGSIGETTLSILNYEKDFKIELLSTNRNANKLLSQAKKFNVKNVIISDKNIFLNIKINLKKIILIYTMALKI